MRFELHCHSTCSDGTDAPQRVAERAAERGVQVFALTDHDTCDGCDVEVPGARVLRATEMSCDHDGRTVHVLAYDRGGPWSILVERLAAVREARTNRLRVMAARLRQRGVTLDVDALLQAAGSRSVGRPDLARAMVASGAATSLKDAFARHLFDGGPVDVPHGALPLPEALAVGRAAGAAMAIAHPTLYDHLASKLVATYKPDGLTGLEAFCGGYDPAERQRWTAVADRLGVVCTGGSDWHGPDGAIAPLGVDLPDERSRALRGWLALD